MESQAEYLERARTGFKIKSDAHIAREIGVTRSYITDFKNGHKQLGKDAMTRLANRAGLDPDEALVLRALWASQIETIPNYEKYLKKFAGVFLIALTLNTGSMLLNFNGFSGEQLSASSYSHNYEKRMQFQNVAFLSEVFKSEYGLSPSQASRTNRSPR